MFKENAERFITERVLKKRKPRWSLDSLIRTVGHVASLADAQGETGNGDNWTVTTARLVGIFRHEQYKMRRIDDWKPEA